MKRSSHFTRQPRWSRTEPIRDRRILTSDQVNGCVEVWRAKMQFTHRQRRIAYRRIILNNKARMKWPDRVPGCPDLDMAGWDMRPRGRATIQRRKPK